jgi:hypothetical protein
MLAPQRTLASCETAAKYLIGDLKNVKRLGEVVAAAVGSTLAQTAFQELNA